MVGEGFGARLRRHRHDAGLSLEELAGASGVSWRAISDMERGRSRRPQARTLVALTEALQLTDEERAALDRALKRRPAVTAPGFPPLTDDFTGRARELARLAEFADPEPELTTTKARVVVLAGAAGLGKTTLAVQAARALTDRFPGGSFFVDLRGMDENPLEASLALNQLLPALGVPARTIPDDPGERSALYRETLRDRQALIVLDNALDEPQVRPLLPGGGPSLTLVTSRRVLAGLEAVDRLHLETLTPEESRELLHRIAPAERNSRGAVAEIADLCGNLPLALRIAGQRLNSRPEWSARQLAARLGDEQRRLHQLEAGELRVATAIWLSYRQLSPNAARTFRRLTLGPGADVGPELATELAGLPAADTDDALDELADLGLLQATADLRHRFHDLVRLFARRQLLAEEADVPALAGRMVDWLLAVATAAGRWFEPGHGAPTDDHGVPLDTEDDADAWLRAEGDNWLGAMRLAAETGKHRAVVDTAEAMHWFSERWAYSGHWEEIFGLGAASARAIGDPVMEATHLNYLSWVAQVIRGRTDLGLRYGLEARALAEAADDATQLAWSLQYVGNAYRRRHEFDEATAAIAEACRVFERTGNVEGECTTRALLGDILRESGRPAEAVGHHRRTLELIRTGDIHPQVARILRCTLLLGLGRDQLEMGDPAAAAETLVEAIELSRTHNVQHVGAGAQIVLSDALLQLGRRPEAAAALREAASILDTAGETERAADLKVRQAALERS